MRQQRVFVDENPRRNNDLCERKLLLIEIGILTESAPLIVAYSTEVVAIEINKTIGISGNGNVHI